MSLLSLEMKINKTIKSTSLLLESSRVVQKASVTASFCLPNCWHDTYLIPTEVRFVSGILAKVFYMKRIPSFIYVWTQIVCPVKSSLKSLSSPPTDNHGKIKWTSLALLVKFISWMWLLRTSGLSKSFITASVQEKSFFLLQGNNRVLILEKLFFS